MENKTHIPWRPMDTAPKDGTEILIIRGLDNSVVKCAANRYEYYHLASPTGWLPLPDEKGFEVPESEPIKGLSEFKQHLWEWHSRPIPEDSYDIEKDIAHLAGEQIMTEDSFFEVLAEFQKKIGNVIETFPPEVLPNTSKEVFAIYSNNYHGLLIYKDGSWWHTNDQHNNLNFRWYYPPVSWEEVKV